MSDAFVAVPGHFEDDGRSNARYRPGGVSNGTASHEKAKTHLPDFFSEWGISNRQSGGRENFTCISGNEGDERSVDQDP